MLEREDRSKLMARTDTDSDLGKPEPDLTSRQTGTATVFVGIAGGVDAEQLRTRAGILEAEAARLPGLRLAVAYPGAELSRTEIAPNVDLLAYPIAVGEGAASAWAQLAAAQAELLRAASEANAQAAVLLHPDLAALVPGVLGKLMEPVLTQRADLVMGSYAIGPFDGLLNTALLAPLTRALYGPKVRFPLAPEFATSARLAARLAMHTHRPNGGVGVPLLWPSTVAAGMDAPVADAALPLTHSIRTGDMELSTVITQLVGSVFAEMETHAPLWQRVRSVGAPTAEAQSAHTFAVPVPAEAAAPIDAAHMVNSFLLGSRSLQEVWSLVLPPVTLLDLKRLTLLRPETFHMPDELWVRIVYDFALSYRMRTINRAHLLGALTPLYLGWAASYVHEVAAQPGAAVPHIAERLALAFEAGKPYLVRRWRWPDRFNP